LHQFRDYPGSSLSGDYSSNSLPRRTPTGYTNYLSDSETIVANGRTRSPPAVAPKPHRVHRTPNGSFRHSLTNQTSNNEDLRDPSPDATSAFLQSPDEDETNV